MQWNKHSKDIPEGAHAFLGGSNYSWLNYDKEKLEAAYDRHMAKKRGVELHALAAQLIKLKQKLPKSHKTLNAYVNDSIGFGMRPEQPLFYSKNCFGTADAIGFRKKVLRIHDLKTGVTKASFHQLEIYAALFCLEYRVRPSELGGCELRIYQTDEVFCENPDSETIVKVMDKIITFDEYIEKIKENGYE